MRVALLPPWQALGGFVALAALGLLWLDRRAVPRQRAPRPALGRWCCRCSALVVLLLPYLPCPGRLPALQLLAGPLRAIVWLAVAGQWAGCCGRSRIHARWRER